MTVLVVCLAYAAVATSIAPAVLSRARWQVWRPRTALVAWHATAGSSSIALLVAVVLVLRRLADLDPARPNRVGIGLFATWGVVFVLSCAGARVLARLDPILRQNVTTREALQDALACHGCTRERLETLEVHTVTSQSSFALSSRAPGPTIVVSTSLREHLTELEVSSVIAHETAHLHQHHHLAVFVSVAQCTLMPWFTPARRLQQATRLLTELCADDAAVKQFGPKTVAGALTKLADVSSDPSPRMRAARVLSR